MIRALALFLALALPAHAGLGMMGVKAATGAVAREAVAEAKAGDIRAAGLAGAVVSEEGGRNLAIAVAQAAVVELVPGGRLAKAGANIVLGAGIAEARGKKFSLGQALASTAGGMAGAALLAPLPGGAFIGGIAGSIVAEEAYVAARPHMVRAIREARNAR